MRMRRKSWGIGLYDYTAPNGEMYILYGYPPRDISIFDYHPDPRESTKEEINRRKAAKRRAEKKKQKK